jgi:hypothetical protein
MLVLAGVEFSREKYSSGGMPSANGAEGLFQIQFSRSTFKTFQLSGRFAAYPSLTTLGRVRLSAESSLRRELYRNLNLTFSVYENYDSEPPSRTPKNDFGTSTSLGWTF